jgi:hypothetical protein
MKIEVTWNRPNGTKEIVGSDVNPNDPNRDDREMQATKALAAAGVFFNQKFGEYPAAEQLSCTFVG